MKKRCSEKNVSGSREKYVKGWVKWEREGLTQHNSGFCAMSVCKFVQSGKLNYIPGSKLH